MATRFIYYDTETTGIRADKDRIIEIAAFDPLHNTSFEKFVNPGCPIPPESTAIHKITDAMVADAPSFAQIGMEFMEFCAGDVILVAHNNDAFDLHFLKNEFQRHALTWPTWKFLDTLKWARRYRPDLPRHSLQFLREIYEIPPNNAHRALADVVVLHKVFSYMIDDLPVEEVIDLMNSSLSTPPKLHQTMPFGKHQGQPLNKIPKNYIAWLASSGSLDKTENLGLKESFAQLGLLQTQPL